MSCCALVWWSWREWAKQDRCSPDEHGIADSSNASLTSHIISSSKASPLLSGCSWSLGMDTLKFASCLMHCQWWINSLYSINYPRCLPVKCSSPVQKCLKWGFFLTRDRGRQQQTARSCRITSVIACCFGECWAYKCTFRANEDFAGLQSACVWVCGLKFQLPTN